MELPRLVLAGSGASENILYINILTYTACSDAVYLKLQAILSARPMQFAWETGNGDNCPDVNLVLRWLS